MPHPAPSPAVPESAPAAAARWQRAALVLLLATLAWRVIYLFINGLDLVADEAYYWDWSRHLDWCYFSKPPLVAWINATTTALLGATTATVRLPAAILATVAALGTYLLTAHLAGPRAGFWALLLAIAAPGPCALAVMMTIDAPLCACWSLALYTWWRALNAPPAPGAGRWWWATGLLLVVGIQAKQMMLVFVPCAFLFLALAPAFRPWLRRGEPYLLVVLGLLALVPLLWWNAHHGWIMLHHTEGNMLGTHATKTLMQHLTDTAASLGMQAGLLSPITFGLLVALLVGAVVAWRRLDAARRYLVVFCAPAMGVMLLLSLHKEVNPNWPLVFYLSGLPLVAIWGTAAGRLPGWPPPRVRWLALAAALGLVLAGLAYALPFAYAGSEVAGSKLDLTARLRGWHDFGHQVGQRLTTVPQPDRTVVISNRRDEVAALAFYLPHQPQVYRWAGVPPAVDSQYELWAGPPTTLGLDALIVLPGNRAVPPELAACFRQVGPAERLRVPLGHAGDREYTLFLARDLYRWPTVVLPGSTPAASPLPVLSPVTPGTVTTPKRWRADRSAVLASDHSVAYSFTSRLFAAIRPAPTPPWS